MDGANESEQRDAKDDRGCGPHVLLFLGLTVGVAILAVALMGGNGEGGMGGATEIMIFATVLPPAAAVVGGGILLYVLVTKPANYTAKLVGGSWVIYSEGPRSMNVASEMLVGADFDIAIRVHSIRAWQAPHQDEPVSKEDVQRIQANISTALSNLRIDWR